MASTDFAAAPATDVLAALLGHAAPLAADADNTPLLTYLIRRISLDDVRGAVDTLAAKLTAKLPEIRVEVEAIDYVGPQMYWCDAHRQFVTPTAKRPLAELHCFDNAGAVTEVCAHRYPADAVEINVRASGLPTFDGAWEVAGILATDSQGVTTGHAVGATVDTLFAQTHRGMAGTCVHCGKNRRRATTIILRNGDTGEVRPVGKSCLADYTGSVIRTEMLAVLTSLDERFGQAIGGAVRNAEATAPTVDVLALAMLQIERDGEFISRARSSWPNRPATGDKVREALAVAMRDGYRAQLDNLVDLDEVTDAHRADARAVIDALLAEEATGDYLANLQAILSADWCVISGKGSKIGMIASAPGAATRAAEYAARRAEREREAAEGAARRVNAWFGQEKQRITVSGTVASFRVVATVYGDADQLIVDTEHGQVKAFGTVRMPDADDYRGMPITLTATVKGHGEYEGTKQTLINRVKVTELG